jgi:O-antigen/teichoic acid export membrane protein
MDLKKQVTLNTAYRILMLFLQILITLIVPVITGPTGFGLYSLVIANASLLATITSFGIPSGLVYHIAIGDRHPLQLERITYLSTVIQLVLVLAGEGIFFYYNRNFGIWPSSSIVAGALGIFLFISIALTEKIYAIYNGYQALIRYNKITVFFSAMNIAALLFSMILLHQVDSKIVIVIAIAVSCIQAIFLSFGVRKLYRTDKSPAPLSFKSLRDFFNYSFNSYLANLFQFLANRVDLWILLYFAGQTELGYYSLSSRLSQLYLILPLIFAAVLLPNIASVHFSRAQLERQIRLMNSLNILFACIGMALAYFLIPVFFGERFSSSILPFIVLVPGMLFKSLVTMLGTYFAGKGLVKINLRNSALSLMIVAALDVLLIPQYQMLGAAVAISIANLVSAVYALRKYLVFEKLSGIRLFANAGDIIWLRNYSRQIILSLQRNN